MAAVFLALVFAFLLGLAPLSSCENPEDMDAVSQYSENVFLYVCFVLAFSIIF